MRIRNLFHIVREILEKNEEARSNDFILIANVFRYVFDDEQMYIPTTHGYELKTIVDMSVKELAKASKVADIPSFENITRTRRKVCEAFPELKGTERCQEGRRKNTKEILTDIRGDYYE